MSVSTIPTTCPRCGTVKPIFAIYVRSDDELDLVCDSQACRGSGSTEPQSDPLPTLPRRIFSRRQR